MTQNQNYIHFIQHFATFGIILLSSLWSFSGFVSEKGVVFNSSSVVGIVNSSDQTSCKFSSNAIALVVSGAIASLATKLIPTKPNLSYDNNDFAER